MSINTITVFQNVLKKKLHLLFFWVQSQFKVFDCVLARDRSFPSNIKTLAITNRSKISLKKQMQQKIEKSQCVSAVLFAPVVSLVYIKWTFIIILNDNDKQTNKRTMIWVCIRLHIRSVWSIMNVYSVISIMIQKDFVRLCKSVLCLNEWMNFSCTRNCLLDANSVALEPDPSYYYNHNKNMYIKKAKCIWAHKSLCIKSLVWSIPEHSIKLH